MNKCTARSLGISISLLVVFAIPSISGRSPAPQAAGSASASFEPLARWSAAVVSGDRAALASLYLAAPPAQAKTPQGNSSDPSEEPAFWSALYGRQISAFNAKILELQYPRPEMASLVLRMEFSLGAKQSPSPFVVEAAQVWLKQGGDWKISMTQRSDAVAREAERLPEPEKPNTALYAPSEEAAAEIQQAIAAASADHKRVILVFGANWCYDCHVLDTAFHSPAMRPIVDANYHVVHVNIGEMDKNLDIAKKYQVPLSKGVPGLAVLASDGSLVFSQQNGEFESSLKLAPADVVAFLQKWKAPAAR
jgi:thioredoxin 1